MNIIVKTILSALVLCETEIALAKSTLTITNESAERIYVKVVISKGKDKSMTINPNAIKAVTISIGCVDRVDFFKMIFTAYSKGKEVVNGVKGKYTKLAKPFATFEPKGQQVFGAPFTKTTWCYDAKLTINSDLKLEWE